MRRRLALFVLTSYLLVACSYPPVAGPKHPTTTAALVRVPNVVGLNQVQAAQTLEASGLIVGNVVLGPAGSAKVGVVLDEQPAPGAKETAGSAVNLTVSPGTNAPAGH